MPRRLFSGRRDGHVAQGGVASFDQLRTKLDYVRELGFNALALMPVQEFRFDRSWGYNPSFYFALESAYGRPVDLRALVDACHQRGLALISDMVFNQMSNDDTAPSTTSTNGRTAVATATSAPTTPTALTGARRQRFGGREFATSSWPTLKCT